MNIKFKGKKVNSFSVIICIFLFINVLSHFLRFETDNIKYISLMNAYSWIILFVLFIYKFIVKKVVISLKKLFLFCMLIITTFLSWNLGQKYFENIFNYKSKLLIFLISILICYIGGWKEKLCLNDVIFIFKTIIFIGLVAVIFAFATQGQLVLNVLTGMNKENSSWRFFSFFSQRNIYAQYCFISCSACLILHEITSKKIYIIFGVLFEFNILITDSQTSVYASAFLLLLYFYLKSKHKIFLFVISILIFVMIYINYLNGFDLSIISKHIDSKSGMDSGAMRLSMWSRGVGMLSSHNAWLQGFGDGSASEFLLRYYEYGSFHNAYMDVLFEGGLIRLVILLGTLVNTIVMMLKSNLVFKNSYITFILSVCLIYFFESGSAIFMDNYFAITTSLLVILLPRTLVFDVRHFGGDLGETIGCL